jgi:PAS domain-containing protein
VSGRDPTGPDPGAPGGRALETAPRDSDDGCWDLFERSLAGVYRTTAAGRILDCNPAFARVFGYDR